MRSTRDPVLFGAGSRVSLAARTLSAARSIKCPSTSTPITSRRSSSPRSNARRRHRRAPYPADGGKEALGFDYGFKVRPFFPRLVEPVAERHKWMDEQKIDHQIVGTWPDIFGYGLPREHCIAWHRMLNDTLAEWTADNAQKFSWISSVPLIDADAAAAELERAVERRRRSASSSPPTSRT